MKFLPDLFLAERAGSDWICQLLWGVLFMYHCAAIVLNVSSVVEFQRWWVPKRNILGQKSTCAKEYFLNTFHQKVPTSYFQIYFFASIIDGFLKSFSISEYQFRRPFFVKKKILTSIFEPLYFLQSHPIFDELALPVFSKYNGFLWVYCFLAKNLGF